MNCSEATLHLDQVRHGDLPESLDVPVRQHLETCAACTERMSDDSLLAHLLRERSDEVAAALPPGFSARVMEALPPREERMGANRRRLFQVFAVGVLGTVAVAAAVVLPIHFSQKSASEAASLAAENEAEIHLLEVSSPETHPLVFKTDDGRTVIWMISDTEFDTEFRNDLNDASTPASTDSPGTLPQK
jgi:anti-sigma factor RsiW